MGGILTVRISCGFSDSQPCGIDPLQSLYGMTTEKIKRFATPSKSQGAYGENAK